MDPTTVIAAVTAALTLAEQGMKIIEERRRNRELTPEEEAAWDRFKAEKLTQPHWQPTFVRPS